MGDKLLISKCRVKSFLRQNGARVSTDFYELLDEKLRELLFNAISRAKKNQRSTVMEPDL